MLKTRVGPNPGQSLLRTGHSRSTMHAGGTSPPQPAHAGPTATQLVCLGSANRMGLLDPPSLASSLLPRRRCGGETCAAKKLRRTEVDLSSSPGQNHTWAGSGKIRKPRQQP